jgi:polyphosphate kinase
MDTRETAATKTEIALTDRTLFINRELSHLEFNRRVLAQAADPTVPLLERLRFLTICGSNLDEFFEIRVAGLRQQLALGLVRSAADGMSTQETLGRIREVAHALVREQYALLNDKLLPALEREGVHFLRHKSWSKPVRKWVKRYFEREVLPVLTPMGLDPAHPFPKIQNKSLNFMVSLEGKDAFGRASRIAVVQAPRSLPRLIALPADVREHPTSLVLLTSIIQAHVDELFPGMRVTGCHQFRLTRNSDLWVDEEEVDDLLNALAGELPQRNYGDAVRLEVGPDCPSEVSQFLLTQFGLDRDALYAVNGPVNLHRLAAVYDLVDRPDLKYPPLVPSVPRDMTLAGGDVFSAIRERDLVLHHPYESFAPVLEMIEEATYDPKALAIKMTLYRTGVDSPVVEALINAARAGKEVTAVVELRARFDEAANIDLATRLQDAGANVVYGVVGYKTHSKMLMVVRREGNRLRRYVHLGTGNYHTGTSRAYTDIGYMTCDDEVADDVHKLFQQLTGLGKTIRLKHLLQSPFTLHKTLIKLIDAEAEAARAGKPSRIIGRINALSEEGVIKALYRASQAGVPIDLVVRGICCLRPGIKGVSDNIRVRSIVDRFLEHSRVYYFHAGGQEATYCSSADWMGRNLLRRVETAFPLHGELKRRVIDESLETYLADNTSAWELQADGHYRRLSRGNEPVRRAQRILLERLCESRPA